MDITYITNKYGLQPFRYAKLSHLGSCTSVASSQGRIHCSSNCWAAVLGEDAMPTQLSNLASMPGMLGVGQAKQRRNIRVHEIEKYGPGSIRQQFDAAYCTPGLPASQQSWMRRRTLQQTKKNRWRWTLNQSPAALLSRWQSPICRRHLSLHSERVGWPWLLLLSAPRLTTKHECHHPAAPRSSPPHSPQVGGEESRKSWREGQTPEPS